jgi:carbonic anhydrase
MTSGASCAVSLSRAAEPPAFGPNGAEVDVMTRTRWTFLKFLPIGTGLLAFASYAGEGAHWGYSGPAGPDHWAELSEEFSVCGDSRNQSPVDIESPMKADLSPLEMKYSGETTDVLNNGHTIQVNASRGSWLSAEGLEFELLQFHFHSPSENRIEGEKFPLEVHFVHKNADGRLAVLAVLFRDGDSKSSMGSIWANIPKNAGESRPLAVALGSLDFIPRDRSYFRYNGSLTTPPCTEGVRWYVLKSVSTVSSEQVSSFLGTIGENAREPQALNSRVVLR